MTKRGAVIDGKYEILKEIGRGGMSVVYLAMDQRLNKQWAVKEIQKRGKGKQDEVVVNSLLAEADLMKRLDHAALPRIVDIIDNGATIYVVMDYIEGESLDKILREYGPQPEERVLDWAKQLCDVLAYLHAQKPPIIYRDMKPANVILKPEGNLKVIDFGTAREYKEEHTRDTTVLGTRGYASPEHYGLRQTDARSDIFTLGMTLHHLLTGADPRRTGYRYAPIRQWNPKLSDGLESIIDKCTAMEPKERYQNCGELMYDLEHPNLVTRDFKRKQKRRLTLFLAAAALTLLTLVSGLACRALASNLYQNQYDTLVSVVSSTSFEEKISAYKNAIEIYPYEPEAYMRMLEAYENEGTFGPEESSEFLALYNANKSRFDGGSKEVAELNYRIGRMYFNYYTEEDGSCSFAGRVQKAYPFFAANYENQRLAEGVEHKLLSDCYYQICSFYKDYILSAVTVEEASREDYERLFSEMERAIAAVETVGAYDRLTLYNGIFLLLYDQRGNLKSVGVELAAVERLLDTVYEKAASLSVRKVQSKRLQREILENYEAYREAVERAYANGTAVGETRLP